MDHREIIQILNEKKKICLLIDASKYATILTNDSFKFEECLRIISKLTSDLRIINKILNKKSPKDKITSLTNILLQLYGCMLALTNGDVSQENSNDKNNIESNSIKFVKGKYGKPLLESSMPIKFSMTTDKLFSSMFLTKGLEDTEVGIDVANVINYCGSNCIDLFRDIFTEQEFNYLSTSPNATTELQKARLFTKYWSFKESYSKYTGEGLNCAFQKVNFGELTIEDDTTIKTYDLHDDIGLVLNFYSKWIDSNRVLTVCYKCSNDHKDNYIVHKRIDLRDVLNYLNGADIFD